MLAYTGIDYLPLISIGFNPMTGNLSEELPQFYQICVFITAAEGALKVFHLFAAKKDEGQLSFPCLVSPIERAGLCLFSALPDG